ncbi:MAG: conserved rane protein of unknown function [Modestobacter sp.]|jgi:hypothetical protein|nr:conserved rane protein of unknown function [Modestobacter sp.]
MSSPATRPEGTRPPLYVRRPLVAGLVRQWPLFLVILGVGVGLLMVALDHWRRGLVVVGLALVVAALFRLLLPLPMLGFLAVRSRTIDVTLTAGAGLTIALVALTLPSV